MSNYAEISVFARAIFQGIIIVTISIQSAEAIGCLRLDQE